MYLRDTRKLAAREFWTYDHSSRRVEVLPTVNFLDYPKHASYNEGEVCTSGHRQHVS
jgi:hypothetical protein